MNNNWTLKEYNGGFNIMNGEQYICSVGGNRSYTEAKSLAELIVNSVNQQPAPKVRWDENMLLFKVGDKIHLIEDVETEDDDGTPVFIPAGAMGEVIEIDLDDLHTPYKVSLDYNDGELTIDGFEVWVFTSNIDS